MKTDFWVPLMLTGQGNEESVREIEKQWPVKRKTKGGWFSKSPLKNYFKEEGVSEHLNGKSSTGASVVW